MIALMLLLACGPKAPTAPLVSPDAPPILPALDGARYAAVLSSPRDPLVADVVRRLGLPWEESLAGAAARLGLDPAQALILPLARQAAVLAGYPHPIVALIHGASRPGDRPPELEQRLLPLVRPGDHVGLVRVRMGVDDRWVALVARPRGQVEPFERELAPGQELKLAGLDVRGWSLISPVGQRSAGPVDRPPRPVEKGEWLLSLHGADPDVAMLSVPIYVGMPTPTAPALDLPGAASGSPSEAIDELQMQLEALRGAFSQPALREEETLASLAQTPLQQLLGGTWDRSAGEARLRAAGFVGGSAAQLTCSAATVALCLDGLLADPEGRAALIDPHHRLWGAAAELRTDRVALVLNLSSE